MSQPRYPCSPSPLFLAHLAVLAITTAAAGAAWGEVSRDPAPNPRDFMGTFRYDGNLDEGRAVIRQAFEDAIDQVPSLFRPFIRKRMTSRDHIVRSFTIRVGPDRIRFRAVSYKVMAVTTRPGETKVVHSGRRGETTALQQFREGHYELILENRRGRMHNLFTLSDDGETMTCDTTFTSRYLQQPISFQLEYRRVERRRERSRTRTAARRPLRDRRLPAQASEPAATRPRIRRPRILIPRGARPIGVVGVRQSPSNRQLAPVPPSSLQLVDPHLSKNSGARGGEEGETREEERPRKVAARARGGARDSAEESIREAGARMTDDEVDEPSSLGDQ